MQHLRLAAVALLLGLPLTLSAGLAAGCSCSEPPTAGGDAGARTDSGSRDGGVPTGDAATDPDAGPDSGTDAGPPPPPVLRFAVMGDTGEGNMSQYEVADVIGTVCARDGCDFVLLLGDNIYDAGVDGVDDPQWQSKFELPYADLDLPFYVVLGNHDYGGRLPVIGTETGGLGNEFEKGGVAVDYTDHSDRWTLPATFYSFQMEHVGFVMLDTNSILWDNTDNGDQESWYAGAVADLRRDGAEWIIAAGHHPYLSNGRHGNAGSYESIEVAGVEIPNPLPILNGNNVEDFFDTHVCGTADMYFCGHDHNRQWINEPGALCGTEMVVSGAGAKVTEWGVGGNEVFWEDNTEPGFMWVEIEGDTFTGRFYDRTGAMNFERTFTRAM